MNLPSDLQRLLPYIAVAVLAVVGLFIVLRGVGPGGGEGASTPDAGRTVPHDVRPGNGNSGSDRTPSNRDRKSDAGGAERAPVKRSSKAYIACVQQATDTAALERCQSFLPRR